MMKKLFFAATAVFAIAASVTYASNQSEAVQKSAVATAAENDCYTTLDFEGEPDAYSGACQGQQIVCCYKPIGNDQYVIFSRDAQ